MIDITHKSNTLRIATAQAIVKVSKQETIDAVINKEVPKGDVLEMAKTAGLFGVKKTAELIPDCHPLPIESTKVEYKIDGLEITINIEVKTVYKTGVEVEAMHGASIVALTIYDMLKPIDKEIEISAIKLLSKKGGKSQFKNEFDHDIKAAVIVSSDSVATGKKEDKAGKAIIKKMEDLKIELLENCVLPDEPEQLKSKVEELCLKNINLIIITGGTGLSSRDKTPEAIKPLIDREIPGVMEAARSYGQQRTPYAMLSRSFAGMKGDTLILGVPGSTKGAIETIDALFPHIMHIFKVQEHDYKHQAVN